MSLTLLRLGKLVGFVKVSNYSRENNMTHTEEDTEFALLESRIKLQQVVDLRSAIHYAIENGVDIAEYLIELGYKK